MDRWFITIRCRYNGSSVWFYENIIIDEHPIKELVEMRKMLDDREIVLLFAMKIPEEYRDIELEG